MSETIFESGVIYINGAEFSKIADIAWQNHSKFSGVFIKNLFGAKESDKRLSVAIVKVEPNCEIGEHFHEGEAELHEVIFGKGRATIENASVEYKAGVVSLIPAKVIHSVKAGDSGLILLAKFAPVRELK
ncbi:MAG: cupin domain-containing protein [Helicobacteraceae bacterium]|jgi:quercetin dioxygenase-like cupin family protein|nr:cupin domain-containing protein [Helicobacteraceae bacterium]